MTRKLDLRTGVPVWEAYRAPRIPTQKLTRDVTCDVLVVGLGISGAMLVEVLSARGLTIIGVDRRGSMLGSTPATTALVQFEIDQPLSGLSRKIGKLDAEQAWRRSRLAVTNLQGRISELGIACDMTGTQSLYLAGNALDPGELRLEAEARSNAGIRASYLTPAVLKEKFGIDRKGAILSHDNLALDPRKLTAGFLGKALDRKARFYAPVEVAGLATGPTGVRAKTKDGPVISARHVVLATGYEFLDIVPSDTHSVISTYAIATKPQKSALWPGAALVWEASDPYLYMRATADGRVICGGEDEDFVDEARRDSLLAAKTRTISTKLKHLFPQLDTAAEFAWTGCFGTTTTGLPYIGELPGHPGIFAVQGYGGNGITFSQIASEIISTTIAGRDDTDAKLFAFGHTGMVRKLVDAAGKLMA
ncbi:FAD-dependent oxidoreductase [Mesorhizobium sp. BAC0120]|uniref:NAD(P)/FAD-dependent oxidoreductase n=1 Tax=Mesorhizobium sp. BAC0120 TaxID=3090670 RepID=UPI00298BFF3D|nr:FAD-dependent oxidoreductase [Mesorhizobium sp. BAC0120]MDW6022186.1 FAD-dependent oxidoreductase [Mesorhizobium sp. BAC0120]